MKDVKPATKDQGRRPERICRAERPGMRQLRECFERLLKTRGRARRV